MKNVLIIDDQMKRLMSRDMRVSMDLIVVRDGDNGYTILQNRLDERAGLIHETDLADLLKKAELRLDRPDPGSIEQSFALIAEVFQNDLRFKALAQVDGHIRQALASTGAKLPPVVRVS